MKINSSKLSASEQARRRIARTNRPPVDNNGKPISTHVYVYDDDGILVETRPA